RHPSPPRRASPRAARLAGTPGMCLLPRPPNRRIVPTTRPAPLHPESPPPGPHRANTRVEASLGYVSTDPSPGHRTRPQPPLRPGSMTTRNLLLARSPPARAPVRRLRPASTPARALLPLRGHDHHLSPTPHPWEQPATAFGSA